MKLLSISFVTACVAGLFTAQAEINLIVTQGEETDLAAAFSTTDLIQGLIPTVLPGDKGWHPANTDPLDQLAAFTDGEGMRYTGLTGLLADYPGDGLPAKLLLYTLPAPADIDEVRVFTGNEGRDGRVFHTYTVRFSSDYGQTFGDFIYVQSHDSGTVNNNSFNVWRVVLSQLTDSEGSLARGVTDIEFNFYAVDNTQGQMRDPFGGENFFTGFDDGLSVPVASPLVWEIDVLGTVGGPKLEVNLSTNEIELTWRMENGNPIVQTASQLNIPDWEDLSPQPNMVVDGTDYIARIPLGAGAKYFRLRIE
ncbi:MAG: hypothetical protein M9920_01005 [Verrucomicrobiae bacterium]|nr:hypothetical protein [Verrucomicrobiae bacterium]